SLLSFPTRRSSDLAVAARAVPPLRVRVGPRTERGKGAPACGRERHGNAVLRVVEVRTDLGADPLEAVDVPPGHLPGAEVALQPLQRLPERVQQHAAVRVAVRNE